jgi:sigma-54 dependent transcriptional regulator, acetoin dehydrogenase operon transcriptional activator AcoR
MRKADDLGVNRERRVVGSTGRNLEPAVATSDTNIASAEIERAWGKTREPPRTGSVRARPQRLLEPAELEERQRRNSTYAIALPILEHFGRQVDPSQQVLAFFDADGWMLRVAGSSRTAEWVADIDFFPGTNWREQAAGDDGLDAASSLQKLAENASPGRVVVVRTSWTCAAASILAPRSGDLLGVVAIAGPWTSYTQARLLARVIATAVEERLCSAQIALEQVIEHAFAAARDPGEGMFAMSREGQVLAANEAARQRLAFAGRDVPPSLREAVASLLVDPGFGPEGEREIAWPGAPARVRLVASPIRHGVATLGALVRVLAARASRSRRPARSAAAFEPAAVSRYGFDDVLGESESIQRVIALARMASRNDLPVVLLGESGTGKELFAQAIHAGSARRDGPFIAVNCGCIPAALLEAELFGYEAGTFTGGREEGKAGKFEEASGGTLFLDEVNELPPRAQTALLRVLQEHEVVRLGGSSPRRVDVRVVAATGRSLAREIEAGRFRADLYYRLNVLGIELPALRDRRSDVPLLARAFLAQAEAAVARSGLAFSEEALRALAAHDWPGNIRELRNVVLRVAATAPAATIEVGDLPAELRAAAVRGLPSERAPGAAATTALEHDRETLLRTLDACSWNVVRAAQNLQVSRMTLYRWLRKFGIER